MEAMEATGRERNGAKREGGRDKVAFDTQGATRTHRLIASLERRHAVQGALLLAGLGVSAKHPDGERIGLAGARRRSNAGVQLDPDRVCCTAGGYEWGAQDVLVGSHMGVSVPVSSGTRVAVGRGVSAARCVTSVAYYRLDRVGRQSHV